MSTSRIVPLLKLALLMVLALMIAACGTGNVAVPGVTDDEIVLGTHTSKR